MRLTTLLILGFALIAGNGCGDDSDSDSDTTAADTSGDDAGEDTTVDEDTTPAQDTTAADTAPADTTPADTTPPDTTPPMDTTPPVNTSAGICPGITDCVVACNAGPADQQSVCTQSCLDDAEDGDELAAFQAYAACMGPVSDTNTDGNNCFTAGTSAEDLQDQADCQRQNCLAETVTCFGGMPAGETTCPNLNGCIAGCIDGSDYPCIRACLADGVAASASFYFAWKLCADSVCLDPTDPLGQELCVQQVQSQPICSDQFTECFGDVGSAPGSAPGGGLPE